MSDIASKLVIVVNYAGELRGIGHVSDHEPQLCQLVYLADGETIFYPITQCKVVPRAQALEIAIASGKYADMTAGELAVKFRTTDAKKLLSEIEKQDEDDQP